MKIQTFVIGSVLALALFLARPRSRGTWPAPQVLPEAGEQFAADGAP